MVNATNMSTSRGTPRSWFAVVAIWASLSALSAAHAASFSVTNSADDPDTAPGDGVCATLRGVCTLRAAMQEANALPGTDTISLPSGTYRLKAGELAVTDDLILTGAGPDNTIISNIHKARVMSIASTATVTIAGVRLQNGRADIGAGLLNDGSATLSNVSFTGNYASRSAGGWGGGINNTGTLTLSNATFARNRAFGAMAGFGGGIYNTGTAMLTDVIFTNNFTNGCGGAIFNDIGALTLTRATVSGNHASNSGAGVFVQTGSAALSETTFSLNRAKIIGGAFYTNAPATLTNTTITNNRSQYGAGLFNDRHAVVTLTNLTISSNTARFGGGLYSNSSSTMLRNTLIAFDHPDNCQGTGAGVTSLGHNLDSGATCGLAATGDLSNINPQLATLSNNGGPTKTCALLLTSPAVDAGDNTGCPATDQRGAPRPAGDPSAPICDIGAYELQP